MRTLIQGALHRVGADIRRARPSLGERRARLLCRFETSLVLDVGANCGQYTDSLRRSGFEGRVVMFEPIGACCDHLRRAYGRDDRNRIYQIALGNLASEVAIHVTANPAASSLYEPTEEAVRTIAACQVVRRENVQIARLDDLATEFVEPDDRVHLKIDTQGYEESVLLGAFNTLKRVWTLEVELSLKPLYSGQPLLPEICWMLQRAGFRPTHFEPGYEDALTNEILQFDGLFVRTEGRGAK